MQPPPPPNPSKKKNFEKMAEERQKKLVLSEAVVKSLEEKYKHLPEKERIQK